MFASRRVVCILTMVMAFGGWSRPVSMVQAADAAKKPQRWAILVGVDDYVYVKDLNYCVADQEALAAQLIASGFPQDQVFLLADKVKEQKYRPSKSNFETQLNLLLAMVEKGDTLLLSFSGHGVHIDGHSYLCPSDAKLEDPKGTMVSLDQVYDDLAKCPAGMKLMLVDACRNDPRLGGERSLDPEQSRRGFGESLESPPQGISLLTSCSPGQFAREDAELGHGVFVHFLLEGLKGKAADEEGTVSLMRLADYTSRETKKYVASKFVAVQTPYFRGEVSGLVELAHIERGQLLPKEAPGTVAKAPPSIKLDPVLERKLVEFNEKIRINPQDWLAYNDRGAAWQDHGDYDKAIADFTAALRISPDAVTYHNLANAWDAKNEYEKALVNYAEAIRLSPKDASIYAGRANTLNNLKSYDKAIENLNYAIRLDPKLAHAYKYRGDAFGGKKESDKAIADYTEAVRLDPKLLWGYKCRGDLWLEKREFDKALADFDKVIRLDPTIALAYGQRGYLWIQKGHYDKALADANEAFRLNLKSPEVYNIRATAWEGKGESDKAIADYGEAIRLDPEESIYFNNRGRSWCTKGDYQKAVDDYTEALRLNSSYVKAYASLASLLATCPDDKLRDGKRAIELANKAVDLDGAKTAEPLAALAAAHAEIGEFKQAVKIESKMIALLKDEDDIRLAKTRLQLYESGKPFRLVNSGSGH